MATLLPGGPVLEFDGVMANSDVWLNGIHLGRRPQRVCQFRYELTVHLKHGSCAMAVEV